MPSSSATYAERAAGHKHPLAKQFLELVERKKSNLCLSIDVTKSADFLRIVEAAAPYVCMIKTHIDIVEDFSEDLIRQLQRLSEKYDFLIFEDRKFADIGNTVSLQYSSGVYKIASWAHFTNAHSAPGEGIIAGLKKVGQPLGRGLLMLAEMSSAGALTRGEYTTQTVEMARRNQDFVLGFIAQRRMNERDDEDFLVLTPGVQLIASGDTLGQQYRTPHDVIARDGCDIIIVGRGIYGNPDQIEGKAKDYRDAGWAAYEERCRRA